MVKKLPFSEDLREKLSEQFEYIDLDNSGGISLTEFLFFFLQYKPFRAEFKGNSFNEPYFGLRDLSFCARTRLWVFQVITIPNFNT